MDTVFREKLEKEHRESKETGKVKLEREKKDKEAAERQRQAVEASQRAKRLEAIESQMMKDEDNLGEEKEEEDDIRRVGGDFIIKAIIPPWMMKTNMPQRVALEGDDNVFEWDDDDEEGAKLEIGDAPGTAGNCKRFIWNVRPDKEKKKKKMTTADGKNTES
ncbi:unnamed protein product [Brassica oleracea var. botrytis]|uniref:Uncharacterized protein n=2 Tax=Brassica TaxID=3705 RepID=A0A3P6FX58_BRAOL|nr:unnamed protein product [Brassica napus]VDD57688.1 unnamed protein product [Brassica oleracea]